MSRPIFAAGISVVVSPQSEVFVEMRDEANIVIAVAGLKVCAAVTFNEQVRVACERALVGQTTSGAVH